MTFASSRSKRPRGCGLVFSSVLLLVTTCARPSDTSVSEPAHGDGGFAVDGGTPRDADAAPELPLVQAVAADAFVDSVGINVRFNNFETRYATHTAETIALIEELGIRHVRNTVPWGRNASWQRYVEAFRALAGIGVDATMTFNVRLGGSDPSGGEDVSQHPKYPDFDRIDSLVENLYGGDGAYASLHGSVVAVTGLNEYAINSPPQQNIKENDDKTLWVETWQQYQQALFEALKQEGRPEWVHELVVVAGPLASPYRVRLLDDVGLGDDVDDYFDRGNAHYYTNQRPEENAVLAGFFNAGAEAVLDGKGRWLTEGGYNDAWDIQGGISERAFATYLPRWFLVNFERGIERSFQFQLYDTNSEDRREQAFGIVRVDGTRKPAFYSLASLTSILGDADLRSYDFDLSLGYYDTRADDFEPSALAFAVDPGPEGGNPTGVRTTLFQKSNGDFFLAIWLDEPVYDISSVPGEDLDVPPRAVRIRFEQPVASIRRYFDLANPNGYGVTPAVRDVVSYDTLVEPRVSILRIVE